MSTPSSHSIYHNGTFSISQVRKSKLACDLPWREKVREANDRKVCLKQSSKKEKTVLINKNIFLCTIIALVLYGCSNQKSTTLIIHDYIEEGQQHNRATSTICLNDVFDVDIDTIYCFLSYQITCSAVRNITGLRDYKKEAKPDMLIGEKFDALHVLFVSNGKVVYEDEFYNGSDNIIFNTESLKKKNGVGEFDGDKNFPFSLFYTSVSCMRVEKSGDRYFLSCEWYSLPSSS